MKTLVKGDPWYKRNVVAIACENGKAELLWLMAVHMDSNGCKQDYRKTLRNLDEGIRAAPKNAVIIMSIDANDTSSALLHHKCSMLDPSYTFLPSDANGDGVCDTLQFSVIDYGTTSATYTQFEEVSLTPTFDGRDLVEVWAPSLPSGLSINNTTGQITGAPDTVDTAGTTYTIYSNSSSASYPYTITFTIRSPTPMLAHPAAAEIGDKQS